MTETFRTIAEYELPYMRKAELREADFDSGMKMLRLVLREGKRITQIDLDVNSARVMGAEMLKWAEDQD